MTNRKYAALLLVSAALVSGCNTQKDLNEPVASPEIASAFNVEEIWSRNTGGVGEFYSRLSPCIDSNTIYMAGRDGDIYAFDKLTGDRIWNTDVDWEDENFDRRSSRLSGGVAAYAGKVAVGSENGYIYLLNSGNGEIMWRHYVGSEILTKPSFSKSGDKLFVLDAKGALTAFDSATGNVLYVSGESTSPLRLRSQSTPLAVGDEYVIVGKTNGKIFILDQATGTIANQITVSQAVGINSLQRISDVSSTPLLHGDSLYATSYQGGFVEYSFAKNAITTKLGYNSSLDLAMDDDVFVIVQDDGHIFCVSRSSNQELWSNMQLTYRKVSAPVIYGSYVVVGDYEGYLYFLDLNDGRIVTKIDIDGSAIYTTPQVDGSNLYVATQDGDLACLRYDPAGLALQKSTAIKVQNDYAGIGVNMTAPDTGGTGFYSPASMTREELMERRRKIIQAVAQMEARQEAAKRQHAEYERRRKAYEAERRRRMSGFGIAPGVISEQ